MCAESTRTCAQGSAASVRQGPRERERRPYRDDRVEPIVHHVDADLLDRRADDVVDAAHEPHHKHDQEAKDAGPGNPTANKGCGAGTEKARKLRVVRCNKHYARAALM